MKSPIINAIITSDFGRRILRGKWQFHNGIDLISLTKDNNVLSVTDGEVCLDIDYYIHDKRWKDKKHSGGNYVIIKTLVNGKVYYFKYLHLIENFVNKGQTILEGEVIGKYGDVGVSYGAHLHLSIYNEKWKVVNPWKIIKRILPKKEKKKEK